MILRTVFIFSFALVFSWSLSAVLLATPEFSGSWRFAFAATVLLVCGMFAVVYPVLEIHWR